MEKLNHNNFPEGIEFIISKLENLETLLRQSNKSSDPVNCDRIDRIEEACKILNCGKSKIYKLTMTDSIPHSHTRTGRLIFSRILLTKWLEENIIEEKKINNVLQNIAESARKK
jgi:excisionase family DNA binding protein